MESTLPDCSVFSFNVIRVHTKSPVINADLLFLAEVDYTWLKRSLSEDLQELQIYLKHWQTSTSRQHELWEQWQSK